MVACCPLEANEEYCAWWSVTKPRARVAHDCEECGADKIKPGDVYERSVIGDDGTVHTYKTCLSCVEIRTHFACDGWIWGQLWSDLEENFFPDMRAGGPCMEGLSPAAKARLFAERLTWWGHLDAGERKDIEEMRKAERERVARAAAEITAATAKGAEFFTHVRHDEGED